MGRLSRELGIPPPDEKPPIWGKRVEANEGFELVTIT
jgi:hypothetical protein